jgi:hypothetical protein
MLYNPANENDTAQHMCPEGLYKLTSSVKLMADICMGYMVFIVPAPSGGPRERARQKLDSSIN